MMSTIAKRLGEELEFIKFSTPTSGRFLHDKVILLAFKKGQAQPSYCVKTVRAAAGNDSIVRGHHNLTKLNALVAGSTSERVFAKAIALYEDEQMISIETALPGVRARLTRAMLPRVAAVCAAYEARTVVGEAQPLEYWADKLSPALRAYFDTLPPCDMALVPALQLGDLTEDNLLFNGSEVYVVDYDRFGEIDLPGFDLFGLLYRFDRARIKSLCAEFMPGRTATRLLFLYYALERTVRKPHERLAEEDIIEGFKQLA